MNDNHTQQIAALLYRYAYGIDTGDFDSVVEMFGNTSILDGQGNTIAKGSAQIKQFYQRIIKIYPDTGTPKTQHVVSNVLIQSQTEDLLKATANYSVFQKLDNGKIEAIICGHYHSVFKPSDHGWEFYQHQTKPLMVGDMSNHLHVSIKDIRNKS